MVHLKNRYCKTYVPVPGFSERQVPVLPQWAIGGSAGTPGGYATLPKEPPVKTGTVTRPTTGVNACQPSYFCIRSMRNKSAPPADTSKRFSPNPYDGQSVVSSYTSSSGRQKPRRSGSGHSVLPSVTGTSIVATSSSQRPEEEERSLERQTTQSEDLGPADSVSLIGSVDPALRGQFDNQSVTTLDAQSVVTDQTVEDRNLIPFQVTFTKSRNRAPSSKRASSPKSVRFSIPDKSETGSQVPGVGGGGTGTWGPYCSRSSDISHSGSSVVDGFFLNSTSNHATSWLNNSENHRPVHTSLSIINSMSSNAESSSTTPTTIMKSRGALSNAKQVPGRYFPPLALSGDESTPKTSVSFPTSTSGRIGSGVSTFSSPSAGLGAANITQLHKLGDIPNFAITSSRSWTKGVEHRFYSNSDANNKTKVPLKAKTYSIGSPGRASSEIRSPRLINQDSQRDTMYNRKKQSFWEMYDANPHKFTISLRDECPSYDPLSVLHSDYYSVRRTPEPVRLTRSSSVKRTSSSPFKGCLEGSTKTLHFKKTPRQSFET